jgi:hypothetical protein
MPISNNEMGRTSPSYAKASSLGKSWLARLKTASPAFQKAVNARIADQAKGVDWRTDPGALIAETNAGKITKVVKPTLADSAPVTADKRVVKDSPSTVPASYESGGILESIKSGLTNFMPAILVIGAVVVGIVIIKSAGKR